VVQATVDVLAEAVEDLELGLDSAELTSAQRILDRLSAKLVVAYGDLVGGAQGRRRAGGHRPEWVFVSHPPGKFPRPPPEMFAA
jgi:hypothetical protein